MTSLMVGGAALFWVYQELWDHQNDWQGGDLTGQTAYAAQTRCPQHRKTNDARVNTPLRKILRFGNHRARKQASITPLSKTS